MRFVAVLALGISTALPAFAQSASDKETARALMDKGEAAMNKKDYPAALQAYQSADKIMRVPTTGLAVARVQAELGQLVDARDTALRVTRIPERPDDPPVFAEARAEAQKLADALAGRIPSLIVKLEGGPASGARITLDGSELGPSLLGVPKKLDPGKHTVTASAAGFEEAKAEVTLAEGAQESVALKLEPKRAGSQKPATLQPSGADTTEGEAHTSSLVYIGFGVGAAGIVVGSITGVMSLSKAASAKDRCDGNTCPLSAKDDADSSKSLATISNIGFAVGLIGIGAGVYGLLSSGSAKTEAPPAARVRPVEPLVGDRFIGVRGAF